MDPELLSCVCLLPPHFAYAQLTELLQTSSSGSRISRARLYHYRDAAILSGLVRHSGRNRYEKGANADEYCLAPIEFRRRTLGRLTLDAPEARHVVVQLFGHGMVPKPVTVVQSGRRALLLTYAGMRVLDDLSARAIAWGLLKWLVRTEVAQELQVTVDLDTMSVTEQVSANATTGRTVNLVTRHSASRTDVRAAVRLVGQRGPNFVLATIPGLLEASLRLGIETAAMKEAIVDWWRDEPRRVHLLEISQAVSLFGVPRVQRRDVRQSALERYLTVDDRTFSHAYFLEGAEADDRVAG